MVSVAVQFRAGVARVPVVAGDPRDPALVAAVLGMAEAGATPRTPALWQELAREAGLLLARRGDALVLRWLH